jgi:hypothetical protein
MTKWTFSALILALPPFAEFQYVELQMSKPALPPFAEFQYVELQMSK